MKTLLFLSVLLLSLPRASVAQLGHVDTHPKSAHGKKHAASSSGISALLAEYYSVKDALVNGKAKTAAHKADGFTAALARLEPTALTALELASLNRVRDSLATGAATIAKSNDIEEQRRAFENFSLNMWSLLKGAGTNEAPIYQQYCPMKKAYWLSSEQAIRNPYFGRQMLRCGSVSATL